MQQSDDRAYPGQGTRVALPIAHWLKSIMGTAIIDGLVAASVGSVLERLACHAEKVGLYESVVNLAGEAVDVINRMSALYSEVSR